MINLPVYKGGALTVISGCMYSGKTTELIRLINIAKIAKLKTVVFKPAIDTRYIKQKVTSHNKISIDSILIKNPKDILKHSKNTQVVGIDEIQFFDESIIDVCQQLIKQRKSVIAAGLNTDFRGEPFGSMPTLLALADNLVKTYAVCEICKHTATRTQRLIKGKPAKYDSPIILVGGTESYTARCANCHKVPK